QLLGRAATVGGQQVVYEFDHSRQSMVSDLGLERTTNLAHDQRHTRVVDVLEDEQCRLPSLAAMYGCVVGGVEIEQEVEKVEHERRQRGVQRLITCDERP